MTSLRQGCRGAALILAMLIVALVAAATAGGLLRIDRDINVEESELARVQARWLLTAALDWSRLVLREDAEQGGPDYLGEAWSTAALSASIAEFIAGIESNTQAGRTANLNSLRLKARIVDLQSFLNVNDLVQHDGKVSAAHFRALSRIFALLNIPVHELEQLQQNLLAVKLSKPDGPLPPRALSDLMQQGGSPAAMRALEPYVAILPIESTAVNLNTASAEVLYAVLDGLSVVDARRLVAERERQPFQNVDEALGRVGRLHDVTPQAKSLVGVSSRIFEVRTELQNKSSSIVERSIVVRSGIQVNVLHRDRVTPQ